MTSKFLWHNDPDSAFGTRNVVLNGTAGVPGSDSLTYTGFVAVNVSDHPLSDMGFVIPFAWARVDSPDGTEFHYERLVWDNCRHGFLDPNFNHTGEAVLLTPTIVTHPDTKDGQVAAGKLGDLTDKHVFGPSSTSAEIGIPASSYPPETLKAIDLLPFADLGKFAVGESKTLDIVWTAHWYGKDHGAVRVSGYGVTLAPDHI